MNNNNKYRRALTGYSVNDQILLEEISIATTSARRDDFAAYRDSAAPRMHRSIIVHNYINTINYMHLISIFNTRSRDAFSTRRGRFLRGVTS